jgi:hypothetical protein
MKKYTILLLIVGFIIYGCHKDDDNNSNNNNQSNSVQLITSSTWKYDTIGLDTDGDGKPNSPLPPGYGIDDCDRDNTATFKSDSTGILNEGTVKCNAGDPQTTSFKWWFKGSKSDTLYTPDAIFGSTFSGDFKVGELSTTRLRVLKAITIPLAGNFTIVLDLKH